MVKTKRDTSIAAIHLRAVLMTVNSSWSNTVAALPPQLLQQHLTKVPINPTIMNTSKLSPPLKLGSKLLRAVALYIASKTPFRHLHLLADRRCNPTL